MKNKTSFPFSGGLYLQTLKKLRIIGISGAVVVTVISAIKAMTPQTSGGVIDLTSLYSYAPAYSLMILLAPIMTFSAFSFLFSRSESDFYHSLSCTRAAVYTSTFAAVLTWVWGTILVSGLVNLEIRTFAGERDIFELAMFSAQYILASLVITAFAAFAASFTGTKVSAVTAFLASCAFVRMILYIFTLAYYNAMPILSGSRESLAILEPEFFAPVNVISILKYESTGYMLYNLFIAFAVAALGCVLFVRRKSDTAEKPAGSRRMHNVISVLISLPIFLYGTSQYITGMYMPLTSYERTHYQNSAAVWLIAAALTYIIYQLVTSRSVKKTAVSLIYLIGPLIICAAVSSVCIGMRNYVYSQEIPAEDIEAVMPADTPYENKYVFDALRSGGADYTDISKYRIGYTSDDMIIAIVASEYKATVNHDLERKSLYTVNNRVTVRIRLKNGRELTRCIIIGKQGVKALYDAVLADNG